MMPRKTITHRAPSRDTTCSRALGEVYTSKGVRVTYCHAFMQLRIREHDVAEICVMGHIRCSQVVIAEPAPVNNDDEDDGA